MRLKACSDSHTAVAVNTDIERMHDGKVIMAADSYGRYSYFMSVRFFISHCTRGVDTQLDSVTCDAEGSLQLGERVLLTREHDDRKDLGTAPLDGSNGDSKVTDNALATSLYTSSRTNQTRYRLVKGLEGSLPALAPCICLPPAVDAPQSPLGECPLPRSSRSGRSGHRQHVETPVWPRFNSRHLHSKSLRCIDLRFFLARCQSEYSNAAGWLSCFCRGGMTCPQVQAGCCRPDDLLHSA